MSVKEYVAVTVNMDQLMQTETNHRKCVMDHIEKKGKPEQVPNENADRSNTTSEPEKSYPVTLRADIPHAELLSIV